MISSGVGSSLTSSSSSSSTPQNRHKQKGHLGLSGRFDEVEVLRPESGWLFVVDGVDSAVGPNLAPK